MQDTQLFSCENKEVGHTALTHGLLAHSTLIGVPGGLVMMGIRNQTSTNPQQSKRLNFQMSSVPETQHVTDIGIFSVHVNTTVCFLPIRLCKCTQQ